MSLFYFNEIVICSNSICTIVLVLNSLSKYMLNFKIRLIEHTRSAGGKSPPLSMSGFAYIRTAGLHSKQ